MKKTSVSKKRVVAKKSNPKLIEKVNATINAGKPFKQIRPFDLRYLGYVLDLTYKATVGPKHELRMVLDQDTKEEVGFALLLNTVSNFGIVLSQSYSHYTEDSHE